MAKAGSRKITRFEASDMSSQIAGMVPYKNEGVADGFDADDTLAHKNCESRYIYPLRDDGG